jgi:putative polyhydroxyalkanoate system protein
MSVIDMRAHHTMSKEDAQEAADELARDLAQKFSIDYGWDEDEIHFERPGVNGVITVGQKEIRIKARLGILLMMLKTRIEDEIVDYLENHFGCTFDR